ncbi:MAG: NAD-dependent deacylase [Bacteroidota bacterium]|jgi:NAD-dependent deacetylase|nr:NAD-dependent deacylase [Bacteroidota bacterium]HNU77280.1 NAD-dependent deacylase [Prolixibacteraceae bacterium]HNZ68830.1 NAD-dependent deacylase [Prolixibacteraceae bacterium]HOC86425.1 NAD-dependent deacylase [Prolixibacteraceae bacterium]HOF55704.1 NAD-dependent deacylase [Prolixibacteraceae bacterium]
MDEKVRQAVRKIKKSTFMMAFTGAGISVESGIPPFRGATGLWSKYDPKVLDISYFLDHGEDCWKFIREIFYDFFGKAKPNSAHFALAEMEKAGLLQAIVTQNIDNLHQMAGSKNVYEFHGNSSRLVCLKCGTTYYTEDTDLRSGPPRCKYDNEILKPDFVFFGEGIPSEAWDKSFECAEQCDVCLVIGSTGEVVPASYVPHKASQKGAFIIEINPESSQFTYSVTDLWLQGKAGDVLPWLMEEIRKE